jgi:CheY-like chemotaxis protein
MASIIIVDDDPTVRLIATELLRDGDHAIVEAGDGDEALKLVCSMHVDLVVLDMLMPNKDGLETITEIRRLRASVRILAISSGGRTGADLLLKTAMAFGADATLAKPLRVDTFASSVDRLLSVPARRIDAAGHG